MDTKKIPETESSQPWELFDPGSYFETEEFKVFRKFLNCKGTKKINLLLTDTNFTIIVRGSLNEEDEMSCVLFHHQLDKISKPRKQEIADMIFAHPGIERIERDRMGNTLATYFGVNKTWK